MAADRRTMVVAVLAVVGLVLVGVVSGAVLTRSACQAIGPVEEAARFAGSDVDEALGAAFPDLDEAVRAEMSAGLTAAAAQLGPLSGIANVTGATSLAGLDPAGALRYGSTGRTPTDAAAATDDAEVAGGEVSGEVAAAEVEVADGEVPAAEAEDGTETAPTDAVQPAFAAVGPTTTVLGAGGAAVATTATFDEAATVVGDGDTLYSLARSNPRTGQVDALLPLDPLLEDQTCVDTATVGTTLAFHLDAGDGQLLLYRADEDGDDAVLELRDPVAGSVWQAPIEVGPGTPGAMGERLDGILGDDLVVLARRTSAVDDPDLPVLTAVDRHDGAERWTVTRGELAEGSGDVEAGWVEVLGVGDDVVVAVTEDLGDDARGATRLAVHDASDGAPVGATPTGDDLEILAAVEAGDGRVLVAEPAPEGWFVTEARARIEGGDPDLAGFDELTSLSAVGDGRFVALTGEGALIAGPDHLDAVVWPFVGLDALGHDERVTLLLASPEGPGAVAVTFVD